MSDFCFVHAADLHLDSPFEGIHNVNPDFARDLKKFNRWEVKEYVLFNCPSSANF